MGARTKAIAATVGLLVFLWVPSVFAATITYTGSYSGATDVTGESIKVSQFNPSLGALLSATFDLSATMTTQSSAVNDGDFYAGWDKLTYQFLLAGSSGYSDVFISATQGPVRISGSGVPDGSFAFSEYTRITGQSPWTQTGPTLTKTQIFTKGILPDFIGVADLSFYLTTINQDVLAVMGQQTGGQPNPAPLGVSTNISAQVRASYDYNPVPIPGAVWLLASGLVGLVGLRRKFQK